MRPTALRGFTNKTKPGALFSGTRLCVDPLEVSTDSNQTTPETAAASELTGALGLNSLRFTPYCLNGWAFSGQS